MLTERTTSTLPLPLSFKLNGNDSSRPVVGSCRVRKAWCALLPVLPSVAVRTILRESEDERVRAVVSGELEDSLNVLVNTWYASSVYNGCSTSPSLLHQPQRLFLGLSTWHRRSSSSRRRQMCLERAQQMPHYVGISWLSTGIKVRMHEGYGTARY